MKSTSGKVKAALLCILLMLTWYYHGGCIQTKNYKWEPSEEEKQEMIERAAQKMVEMQEKEAKK